MARNDAMKGKDGFDRIIVSADEDNLFFEFWPIVTKAWKKFHPDVPVSLAFVSDRSYDDPMVKKLETFGEVILFPRIADIPSGNQAKISRFALASYYVDEVCMIEDIDTIPLQREFVDRVVAQRQSGELLCVGYEVYQNTPHEGKFPVSNITAEGRVFREIINPSNVSYRAMLEMWKGLKVFDEKESIDNPPGRFSDESLLRVLITRWGGRVRTVRRDVDIRRDWIDRSWWSINEQRLNQRQYVTCNFLRPFVENIDHFGPIIRYITGSADWQTLFIFPPLRVLVIQQNGRHEANKEFRECFSIQRALTRLGHTVVVWGLGHPNFSTVPDFSSFDLILNLENYDTQGWVPNIRNVDYPVKMLWSIDAHVRGLGLFTRLFREQRYDLILQSSLPYVDRESVWFPNAFDRDLIQPADEMKKEYPLGYCGSVLNREDVLDHLEAKYGLHKDIGVLGKDMVRAVCSYRAHFNRNLSVDINYRSFETIACGTLLITNYNPQYEHLGFIDGVNCLMYHSYGELDDKIRLVTEHPEHADRIAQRGLSLAKRHTYDERMKYLLLLYARKRSAKGYKKEKRPASAASHVRTEPLRVSALVSTYNGERFIKGCLDDLVSQTLFKKGRLEVIVVDSGSQQREAEIVQEYRRRYSNIVLIRSESRETVYTAWNRAIRASSGTYVTNANVDDRHDAEALERLADILDCRPAKDLAYADVVVTEKENETFAHHTLAGSFHWLEYSREMLVLKCFIGPQPLWRRSLHDRFGYFDESFTTSGDWEFWLRAAGEDNMLHVPEFLGLYLRSPRSVEHRNDQLRQLEDQRIRNLYLGKYLGTESSARKAREVMRSLARLYPGDPILEEAHRSLAGWIQNAQFPGLKADEEYLHGVEAFRLGKHEKALKHFRSAQDYRTKDDASLSTVTLEDLYLCTGECYLKMERLQEAKEEYEKAFRMNPQSADACYGLGVCFYHADCGDIARQMFETALVLRPGWQQAESMLNKCSANAPMSV